MLTGRKKGHHRRYSVTENAGRESALPSLALPAYATPHMEIFFAYSGKLKRRRENRLRKAVAPLPQPPSTAAPRPTEEAGQQRRRAHCLFADSAYPLLEHLGDGEK